ncbi:Nucleolar 16 [Hyphodiscus hymeniophilus]|uniref:Nucleolar protein 16 n=1 Tax=Hyphodiscus hymeniophilus TaxID=353542 RepID=A0A9P6VHY7_9HELO|nr:Nucleolar 16 [Hyphodiscus hymeniophilus]
MGRELQKKKNRSSIAKVRQKPKSKKVNPLGNAIIAANWNQHETLTQNYRRLGLTSRLNTATGGSENLPHFSPDTTTSTASKLAIANTIPKTIEPTIARVERDPATGKITRVIHDERENPLRDPLNDVEDAELDGIDGDAGERGRGSEVVRMLEEQAKMGKPTPKRKQSEREREWIERLVARWGEDYGKMVRDRRLNPMQQTEADIKKRVATWKADGGVVAVQN